MARPTGPNDPANKRLFSHRRVVADLVRLLGGGWELWRSFEVWYNGILRPRVGAWSPAWANMMETPTMLAETLREWDEQLIDKGRQEGRQERLEEERARLCSMAERRFGAAAGYGLAGILTGVEDNAELSRVGILIVDCTTGQELLARARAR